MKPAATARTCTDIAADLRLRIWTRGGTWVLYVDYKGNPCFEKVGTYMHALTERMTSLTKVCTYDYRSMPEQIAVDVAAVRATQ